MDVHLAGGTGNLDTLKGVLDGKMARNHWVTAAVAKSLQSCPTLCNTIDGSPPGSSVPGILQARILEWVAISFFKAYTQNPGKGGQYVH